MTNAKSTTILALTGILLLAGCQPSPKQETRRFGRLAFGDNRTTPLNASTQVTYLTNPGGDMVMSYEATQFAAPALDSQPQWQLGYVSATTGVKIWSESYIVTDGYGGASGSIDSNRSRLHIEVSDSRTGQTDSDGNILQPFVMHIGYDQTGFEGATGTVTNGMVDLTFNQSGYGKVSVRGQLSGNTFAGQVYFNNTSTNGEHFLGQFNVNACSFFVCQ